jgi:uncharacterized membrane protein
MYDLNQDYSLGQLVPFVLLFICAYAIAKLLALTRLANKGNSHKWSIFLGFVCGLLYADYMEPHLNANNSFVSTIAPFIAVGVGTLIGWVLFYLAFIFSIKDKD